MCNFATVFTSCAFLNLLVLSFGQDFELLILHNNDMHARFDETSKHSTVCTESSKRKNQCYGGFARTAHLIREARKAGGSQHVIYLNAGDTFTGTEWFSVHRSKIAAEFMNILKPDAMSFGNHEFDTIEDIVPFINSTTFPIIAANLDFKNEPALKDIPLPKSVVLDVAGTKIGVIGYLLPETAKTSLGARNVLFRDEVESLREESEKLQEQGVGIIIALGHSGIVADVTIAREVPLVDVVIGGHTNSFLWNGDQPDIEKPYDAYPLVVRQASGKKVYVAQAYAFTKYMGYLKVKFNQTGDVVECGGQPLLVDHKVPQDLDILQILDKYKVDVEKANHEVIGQTKVALNGGKACIYKECNFGNLVSDAFVEYYASSFSGMYWTDAPIAIVNSGTLRSDLQAEDGVITRGILMNAIPYENSVIVGTLNGTSLLKCLEVGVGHYNGISPTHGGYLQTSGLRVIYDLSRPVGSRVVEAKARCGKCSVPIYEPIDPSKSYRVVTSGYIGRGGDGHTEFRDNGRDVITLDLSDVNVIVWYIKKYTPVHPEIDKRAVFLDSNYITKTKFTSKIETLSKNSIGKGLLKVLTNAIF